MRIAPGVIAGVLAALTLAADAQPASNVERAKDLYKSAEAAMREGRHEDAIRDYGAAYEITKDPTFFYKIGSANERAGKCDVALIYYRRYLKEGKPKEDFAKLTAARIEACGGNAAASVEPGPGGARPPEGKPAPKPAPAGATPPKPEPKPAGGTPPKPAPAGATPPKPEPKPRPEPAGAAPPEPEPVAGGAPPAGEGGAAPRPAADLGRHRGAWLLVGGSIAFATAGAVLAYSANAAERDVEDLYVGLNGTPPPYNGTTRKLYEDAVAEGERYEMLSIVGFGLAGAMAVGAAIWFVVDRDERVTVAPAVASGSAGVTTTIRF